LRGLPQQLIPVTSGAELAGQNKAALLEVDSQALAMDGMRLVLFARKNRVPPRVDHGRRRLRPD
jgi:hypothetical protein